MAGKARLRCTDPKVTVTLPWWPSDVSRTLSVRTVNELERPDKTPLAVPSSLTLDDYSIGYTARAVDFRESVADHIADLERLAALKRPAQLILADQTMGLYQIESASLTILEFAESGQPSVVDVQLTLKRASDAEINVGIVKRIKGRGRGFAKKKG